MKDLIIPKGYKPILDLKQTERAIKHIKDFFENNLAAELSLRRVSAPLFVLKGTGVNDDLSGIEKPVTFSIKDMGEVKAEIVHSLAKWKRMMLADYDVHKGHGLYVEMNALRPDEEFSNIHSLYVDQWDWERVMRDNERNLDFLKKIVKEIYSVITHTEYEVYKDLPEIEPILPEEITFLHAEDLLKQFPNLTPKEREQKVAKEYGAVFIIGIGGELTDGKIHDGRAPDYDDWTTESAPGYKGLNGDIVLWNPVLEDAFEVSSMGIRVNKEALLKQLDITGTHKRDELYFHKRLIDGDLPQSIGGGIGQSRMCMFFLRKAHIGEVQASVWPQEVIDKLNANGIKVM